MKPLKFDVFGRDVSVVKTESGGWQAFYSGPDGKRRPAENMVIPPDITVSEMARYLEDLCHESATARNKSVKRLR